MTIWLAIDGKPISSYIQYFFLRARVSSNTNRNGDCNDVWLQQKPQTKSMIRLFIYTRNHFHITLASLNISSYRHGQCASIWVANNANRLDLWIKKKRKNQALGHVFIHFHCYYSYLNNCWLKLATAFCILYAQFLLISLFWMWTTHCNSSAAHTHTHIRIKFDAFQNATIMAALSLSIVDLLRFNEIETLNIQHDDANIPCSIESSWWSSQ